MTSGPIAEELRTARRPRLVVEPDPGRPPRVALLPGSFDPITVAHAALADAAGERADTVVLLYSVRTLPKEAERPLLPEPRRIAALRDFSRSRPETVVGLCSHGLLVEEVRAARRRFRKSDLQLVIGSDKLLQLFDLKWYRNRDKELEQLFRHATVLFAMRTGDEPAVEDALEDPANARWIERIERLDVSPEIAAVSSSLVRSLLRQGQDIAHLLPGDVRPRRPGE